MSDSDEFKNLDDEEMDLLADIYPEMKKKLELSAKKRRAKSTTKRPKAVPLVLLSSDDEDDVMMTSPPRMKPIRVSSSNSDDSFHSAQSHVEEQGDVSMGFASEAPEEDDVDHIDESMREASFFIEKPRPSCPYIDDEAEECNDEEEDDEGERADGSGESEDEDESVHSSDDEFINDEEEDASIDQSFNHQDPPHTPINRRVLPSRSTKTQFMPSRRDELGNISPSRRANRSASAKVESSDEDGEESFEKYLRKLREEDEKKKREQEAVVSDDDREDSFIVSDDSVDVIDDEYENGSSYEEEEEEEEEDISGSFDSDDDAKENRRTKKSKEELIPKKGKNKNLTSELADMFNSPSVRYTGDKESRDPDRHFILSLSENYEGKRRHPDAEVYVRKGVKGEKTRAAIVARLFEIYNREVFEEKLPSTMPITFNPRLRKTAGYCKFSVRSGNCTIELSPKVLSKAERIRDTLAHEMCHAAVFLINGLIKEAHGQIWKSWTYRISRRFRGLPVPERCHSYEIDAKFVYQCNDCGQLVKRHTKSFDTNNKICGRCHGRFVLMEKENTAPKKANPFALFVKEHYGVEKKKSGRSHKEVMQILSARFKESRQEEKKDEDMKKIELNLSIISVHDEE